MASRRHSGQDEDVEGDDVIFHERKHVKKDRPSVKTSGDLPQDLEGSEKKRHPKLHQTSSDGGRNSLSSDSEASHEKDSDGDLAAEHKVRHSSEHCHRRSHLSATEAMSGKSAGSSYHGSSDEKKHNPGTEISRLSEERQKRRQERRERKREVFLSDLDECIKASKKRGWHPGELRRFRRRVERLDIRQSDYEDLFMERREDFLLKYKEVLQKEKKKLDRLDDEALRGDSDNRLTYVESELVKVYREKEIAAFVQRVKDHMN